MSHSHLAARPNKHPSSRRWSTPTRPVPREFARQCSDFRCFFGIIVHLVELAVLGAPDCIGSAANGVSFAQHRSHPLGLWGDLIGRARELRRGDVRAMIYLIDMSPLVKRHIVRNVWWS